MDIITIYAANRAEAEALLAAKGFPKSSIRINSQHTAGRYEGGTVTGTNNCANDSFNVDAPWVIVARR